MSAGSRTTPDHVAIARPNVAARPTLSLVVPAFNEQYRLPALLDGLRRHIDTTTTEVLVVDDGSTDNTADMAAGAQEYLPCIRVIAHARNRGKGAAVRTGVAAAAGGSIGFLDADNATDLAALPAMVQLLDGHVGGVFGSRHAPGSVVTGSPRIRGWMGRTFNHVVRFAAGTVIEDTQCGAKVFDGAAARLAFGTAGIDGFAFDVEVLRTLLLLGVPIVEHPVSWHHVHGTKIQLLTPLKMLSDIAKVRVARTRPMVPFVDSTWSAAAIAHADPLFPSAAPKIGDRCRILLAGGSDDSAAELCRTLELAGSPAESGQTKTWLNDFKVDR